MNDTRDKRARELSRTLWRSFWTGFAITTIACWLGYELARRECAR